MASNAQSSKNSSKSTTYDNDIVADNGAVALGGGASFNDESMETGSMRVGGEGNTVLGIGSSYIKTDMSQNTANLLDSAMTMVSSNAENVIELAAARDGVGGGIDFMNPEKTDITARPTTQMGAKSKTLVYIAVFGGAVYLLAKKRGRA